jgi:hypothetical protein
MNEQTAHDGRPIGDYPLGTKAPAIDGGHWYRNERGWKWNGPAGTGGTFPRPGGDWNGMVILPEQGAAGGRGSLEDEYNIYRSRADDGRGGDITSGGKPLKTFDEWLNS